MKILLTGAEGFTGRLFAEHAAAAGHTVVALQANLTNADALRDEVLNTAPDAVVHLAAISFVGHAHDEAFYAVNVIGTTNLLNALVQLPVRPRRVLLASSANIYGNTAESPIGETHAPAPVNHYGMSKLAMEYMARTYADRLDLVITRPFNYTGPGQDDHFLIPKLAMHFAAREPSIALGNLDVEREFNDVRMVCDAYLLLLSHGEPGETYNICSGQPYALRFVIDTFARLTGYSPRIEVNPAFVRANEVHRLCGSATKLQALFAAHSVTLLSPPLEETLQRMLQAAGSGKAT
ncbi:nucleoside-diphosphate-sugar epimerase [Variovorax boronicumulans]|uniref:NAD-dependent epimerase/dehydratase family protein n=1 Tax=Variovorax boronicumulans TaxID=436515 RepID=UPI0027815BC4|nr:NAD-dependent epimerase/dehydratase family protein [Variovorax boronicumulans]MDQ0084913.1 nucleoside-diphosphate-sugar epimerase [Variovorax boronicumulans]